MKLKISHCNNIDSGEIEIQNNNLNIKYAMNGTGKSTIARAIELNLSEDRSIEELTPFKVLESENTDDKPMLEGLENVKSISVFNDDYISQFVFKQDEVLANSFEIFVKTPDYEKQLAEIEKLISTIKNTFTDSEEINQVITDLSILIDSFGRSKSGYSKAGALAKGMGQGNKIANIPKGLESYSEYLQSKTSVKSTLVPKTDTTSRVRNFLT